MLVLLLGRQYRYDFLWLQMTYNWPSQEIVEQKLQIYVLHSNGNEWFEEIIFKEFEVYQVYSHFKLIFLVELNWRCKLKLFMVWNVKLSVSLLHYLSLLIPPFTWVLLFLIHSSLEQPPRLLRNQLVNFPHINYIGQLNLIALIVTPEKLKIASSFQGLLP